MNLAKLKINERLGERDKIFLANLLLSITIYCVVLWCYQMVIYFISWYFFLIYILSSMVTHTRNWSSAFNPSKCTHTAVSSEHTHTVNTHPEQWAAIAPAPGEQLWVRYLAQRHLSHGIEGGESAVHSQSPPSIPAGPEIRTHKLWITSLTL